MSRYRSTFPALVLFAGLCLFHARSEAAQSLDACVGYIDSVPATISSQGIWCLRHDLGTAITSGSAVNIVTNNVTIDCNGFKLGGQGAGDGTGAYGISASNRGNITVRHCTVRGFFEAISLPQYDLASLTGHLVEDNRLDGNTGIALVVGGSGSVIRRNQITDTGGSTYFPGFAKGIEAQGSVDVLDNTVSGVVPFADQGKGSVTGISAYSSANGNANVNGNRVRGLVHIGTDGSASGITVYNADGGRISMRDNDVVGDSHGNGLTCFFGASLAKDNIVSGFTVGNSGCLDAGGNAF